MFYGCGCSRSKTVGQFGTFGLVLACWSCHGLVALSWTGGLILDCWRYPGLVTFGLVLGGWSCPAAMARMVALSFVSSIAVVVCTHMNALRSSSRLSISTVSASAREPQPAVLDALIANGLAATQARLPRARIRVRASLHDQAIRTPVSVEEFIVWPWLIGWLLVEFLRWLFVDLFVDLFRWLFVDLCFRACTFGHALCKRVPKLWTNNAKQTGI